MLLALVITCMMVLSGTALQSLAHKVLKVSKVYKDLKANKVKKAPREIKVTKATLAPKERRATKAMLAKMELLRTSGKMATDDWEKLTPAF